MQRLVLALAFATMAAAAGTAAAAPIYRCGNTYSQQPCPEGRIVEATDPRSAAQRAEARRVAAAERKAAAEAERKTQDKAQDKVAQKQPGSLSAAAPASAPASAAHKGKTKSAKAASGSKDFVAAVPRDKVAGK